MHSFWVNMHANGGYLVIIFQKYFNFNWPLEIFREELSFNLKEKKLGIFPTVQTALKLTTL